MSRTTRQIVLILLVFFLVTGLAVSGYRHGDVLAVSLLAFIAWVKKLITLQGILLLLKKLPLMLFVGSKKLLIKVLGGLLLFSARTRFKWAKRVIVEAKLLARYLMRRLRYHWLDMALWERALVWVLSIPLTLALLALFLLLAFIPKSLRNLFIRKAQESTAASVIDKVIPEKAREQASRLQQVTKAAIRDKLRIDEKKPDA